MPVLKTYNVFISHAWVESVEYNKMVEELTNTPLFLWKNYSDHDPGSVTPELVFRCANEGDAVATKVRDNVVLAIGIGLGSILNTFDPEALIVGGGVMHGLADHWDEVIDSVKRHSLAHFQDNPRVHLTTLGDDVGLLGSAGLALMHAAS